MQLAAQLTRFTLQNGNTENSQVLLEMLLLFYEKTVMETRLLTKHNRVPVPSQPCKQSEGEQEEVTGARCK